MARPRILTPEEVKERKRLRNRAWDRQQRAKFKAPVYIREPIISEPIGLYGDGSRFPIFTFALQDTLKYVRGLQ